MCMFTDLSKYEPLIPGVPPRQLEDLNPDLRLYSDDKLDVWYSPMGMRPENPSVWILGITPGWNQMRIAYEEAATALQSGSDLREAVDCAKPKVAFAGSMRANLISMLDEIGLNRAFDLTTTENLFGSHFLRTGSVLRYPVFNNGKNYTGSSPTPTRHAFLKKMLDVVLAEELETVSNCMIIPLGKTVEQVLEYSVEQGRVDPSRILSGFPHPSGANGHRISQFNKNKESYVNAVKNWF
jgi:hypothetical protein